MLKPIRGGFALAMTLCLCLLPVIVSAAPAASSPLANREQLHLEQRAMTLVARPDVRSELPKLAALWKSKTPGLTPQAYDLLERSLDEMAFGLALEVVNADPRRPQVVQSFAPAHRWFDTAIPGSRWGIDNPDTIYRLIPVEPASRYVITGRRAAHGPADSNISYMNKGFWGTISNIAHDELDVAADGTFTVTLDDTPANGRRNHIQLVDDGEFIFLRNTFTVWHEQTPDAISVERVDGPAARAAPTDDALARALLSRLHATVERTTTKLQPMLAQQPLNTLPQPGTPDDKPGFLSTQRNTLGRFQLQPDDAVIVTVNPGGAAYVCIPLANAWSVTLDYRDARTSLNNAQARRNEDGTITAVIAARDPGIANWIDTRGVADLILMLRWQGLPKSPSGQGGPWVKTEVVKAADLPKKLANAPRVSSSERAQQLAQRESGMALRYGESPK